ncbi:Double-stranded RNA-specific editase 1 [Amphibalanus amphitrite]|uniref:Double-stranded RNA-specific editase 1 n=1 Tax=Amphibalanus amphitrite TaxID=1232801 RepID=A0A6A4WA74_AMPAM|nr:Double-stranded RNA-specific editase 1 [Amphibalanus amphitrite]
MGVTRTMPRAAPEATDSDPEPTGHELADEPGCAFHQEPPPPPAPAPTADIQRRKKLRTGPAQPKNAVSALNELKPGLEYKVIQQEGPTHAPTFTVQIEVNGEEFVGTGRSKKQAKQTVAEAALRSFIQFKNVPDFQLAINPPAPAADFTADVGVTGCGDFVLNKAVGNGDSNGSAEGTNGSTPRPRLTLTPADKNPVQLLNELRPGLKYDLEEESGEPHAKKFSMSVLVDGEKFDGVGPSKRLGKAAAAKAALSKLYNYSFVNYTSCGGSDSPYGSTADLCEHMSFPQTVADHISKVVNQQFQTLMENQQSHSRRKVLAGLVMTTGPQMSEVKVISVTTGTKCINGEHMSVGETEGQSIFEPRPEGRGYRLKENVQFHLYINTAPCGDARYCSFRRRPPGGRRYSRPTRRRHRSDSQDKHPNRKARGQLRTKIESGEGTIPVKSSDGIQTWDGVLQGQRLLTMSCSDKIARWNVVGVQGALLAHFIEPIYLASVVLGSLFHPSHLVRAIGGRIGPTAQGLPPPFRLHTPLLAATSSPEVRQPGKAPNYSINWTCDQPAAEVINAMTGKNEAGQASRLCKRYLFVRFRRLVGRLRPITETLGPAEADRDYGDVKRLNQPYTAALGCLVEAFQRAELGNWVKKPIEQDMFRVDPSEPLPPPPPQPTAPAPA